MNIDEAFKIIKDKGIEYIAFHITDVFGKLYALWVASSELEAALKEGIGISGNPYFGSYEKSDILLKPDMNSFRVLPWSNNGKNIGAVICDIYHPDKPEELEEAPRSLLKRAIRKLKIEIGDSVNLYVAPEHEFYLIKRKEDGGLYLHDQGAYLSPPPSDKAHELRADICRAFEQMGTKVIKHHHEVLRGKHEIDIEYDKALDMADKVQFNKLVVRKMANDQDLIATFMPKPFNVPGGAGWHTHISLIDEKQGKNLFYSGEGRCRLSDLALQFIAGVLKHAKALTAIANPAVNSYKRLVPGYQAPIYISWAQYNRTTLLRIPVSSPKGARFEYRATDGLCNFYLFFTALIYAGLDGLDKAADPPSPIEKNVDALTEEEKIRGGIERLPRSLGEALEELRKDEIIKSALEPLTPKFLMLKDKEWQDYSLRVHDWERQEYLEENFTRFAEFRETGVKVLI